MYSSEHYHEKHFLVKKIFNAEIGKYAAVSVFLRIKRWLLIITTYSI